MPHDFQSDLDAIGRMGSISSILDIVCRSTGMGFAAVARVTSDRWVACKVLDKIAFGLEPGGELPVATTLCHEIRQSGTAVVIDHVAENAVYSVHPCPALYGFQSYISVPIVLQNGAFFGTLCAIDPKPARLDNPQTVGMFKVFADLIAAHIDSADRLDVANQNLAVAETALADERRIAELREQFVAVLGHDLRNSVAAVSAGASLLARTTLSEQAAKIVNLLQGSVLRMGALIANTLDFARARLGEGLVLDWRVDKPLEPVLRQVVAELQITHPGRRIETHLLFADPFKCDVQRIGQILSNLLGNALTHGAADAPIAVVALNRADRFELSVTNAGAAIPPERMDRLFEPFYRGGGESDRRSQQGLGLGLYIAHEIALAHDGTLTATSHSGETRFIFSMPVASTLHS